MYLFKYALLLLNVASSSYESCAFTWGSYAMRCYNNPTSAWAVNKSTGELAFSPSDSNFDEAVAENIVLAINNTVNASVQISFPEDTVSPSGLIVRVRTDDIGPGADNWYGYEISVWPGTHKNVRLGGHCHNYRDLTQEGDAIIVPHSPVNLNVIMTQYYGSNDIIGFVIMVDGKIALQYTDTTFVKCTGTGQYGHIGIRAYNGKATFSDLVVSYNPSPPFPPQSSIFINANHVIGSVSPYMRGAGIEDVNHELYGGIYSQMIFGENFEEPSGPEGVSGSDNNKRIKSGITWSAWTSTTAKVTFFVSNESMAGSQSQGITRSTGQLEDVDSMHASIINYGLDTQGMYLQADKEYTGFIYAKSISSMVNISVALLRNSEGNIPGNPFILAEQTFLLTSDNNWTKLNFSLIPKYTTSCNGTTLSRTKCKKNPELVCIECNGGFAIRLLSLGTVLVDYAYLQPGEWGRYMGLPVRKDIGQNLVGLGPRGTGMTVLRLGGTMCNAAKYRWKNFRGPQELRQPYRGFWYNYATGGWRMFEFLNYCEIAQIKCVVTFNNNENPDDMSDLVEYLFGNETTKWGHQRINDGHIEQYKPFMIEIGNEQALTSSFVNNVVTISKAMSSKAEAMQLPFKLEFAIGHNYALRDLNNPLTETMLKETSFLGSNITWDCHVGGDSMNDALHSWTLLTSMQSRFKMFGSKMRLSVFEENGNHHDLSRALGHARQINRFSRLGEDFYIDTSANCLQAQSRNDNGWDQGIMFYLPNMTWLSPLGYSIQMISHTDQPNLLEFHDDSSWNGTLDILAVQSKDGMTTVVRVVNTASYPVNCSLTLFGLSCQGTVTVQSQELYDTTNEGLSVVNPPGQPDKISPRVGLPVKFDMKTNRMSYRFKKTSFTTLSLTCAT